MRKKRRVINNMCITIGQVEAKLTGTKIYVGEAMKDGNWFMFWLIKI